ncbi:MAG TPA: DUF3450 domain-containing protein [bacterium]|nr:DUF3450 domain-containing protein [bacterium]
MKEQRNTTRASVGLATALGLGLATIAAAGELDPVLAAEAGKIQVAQASQQRIDKIVDETGDLETQYKQVTKELDGLRVYNDYLERQIADQIQELEELRRSIDQVSSMERQIMPLMIRMLDALDRFVELDVPFLHGERTQRVARLREIMERADVSSAEKFRRITEAFQIEIDYGRTIETYKDSLEIGGATLEVNVLRLGRIGLYYQTADASQTGMWDIQAKEWAPLADGASRNQVRQGLRIAEKQIAPDLLLLPVPAPEAAS